MTRLRGAAIGVALAAFSIGGHAAQAASDEDALFGRAYDSQLILVDGYPSSLFHGPEIRVAFDRREDGPVVRWRSECNHFGASVRVTESRLVTGPAHGTDMLCDRRPKRQDRWLRRFFGANPNWRLWGKENRRLTLTAGRRQVNLRRPSDPN